ncbi:unnamed protein product [Calicophoron daubneyi]|uniref:Copper transport protein n=1 Tax=Calicophoron daubneyi TaxID=300641 RepID=A0AAV2TBE9_CALDB
MLHNENITWLLMLKAFRERLLLMAACRGCCPPPGNPGVLGRPAGSSCPGCSRSGGQEADKALVGGDDNGDTPQFRIPSSPLKECIGSYFDKYHLAQTGLHLIQMFVSYMLMLIVMAYNVQLLMAVVLGLAFGYFFCSHRRPMLLRSRTCCH